MVATIDGKILTGERDEPVMDLGSELDHRTMRQIEEQFDAVLIGAGSLRATPGLWYPAQLRRYVVSGSGNLDFSSRFFTDVPDLATVVAPPGASISWQAVLPLTDWRSTLESIVKQGVRRLLVEGGSMLNAQLLQADLVDEIFLTVAPKIKLGKDVPTIADGEPLPRKAVMRFDLISCRPVGDEVFLRYRRLAG
ncbi:MAG: hypothetical protein HONBIEJF_01355 [Fimbriimonadaceae bacterium]|nr:hypothetical protein [Fimbriimonadaceae bacterium]